MTFVEILPIKKLSKNFRYQYNVLLDINEIFFFCTDYDDCVAVDQPCYENAECVNKPGTYVCVCMNGYAYNEEIEICEGNF